MHANFFAATLIGMAVSGSALADNLITCRFNQPIGTGAMTGCSLTAHEIANPKDYEVTFNVRYKYECDGAPATVGVQGDKGFVAFTRGSGWQDLDVTSKAPVSLQTTDTDFYRKTFRRCSIEIEANTKIFPANDTLIGWRRDGGYLVGQINDAIDALNLARAYSDLRELPEHKLAAFRDDVWIYIDKAIGQAGHENGVCAFADAPCKRLLTLAELETTGLKDEWEDLLYDYPTIDDLAKVHAYLYAKIAGTPSVYQPADLAPSFVTTKEELVRHYTARLRLRKNEASRFVQKVGEWQDRVNAELAAVIAELRRLIA